MCWRPSGCCRRTVRCYLFLVLSSFLVSPVCCARARVCVSVGGAPKWGRSPPPAERALLMLANDEIMRALLHVFYQCRDHALRILFPIFERMVEHEGCRSVFPPLFLFCSPFAKGNQETERKGANTHAPQVFMRHDGGIILSVMTEEHGPKGWKSRARKLLVKCMQ